MTQGPLYTYTWKQRLGRPVATALRHMPGPVGTFFTEKYRNIRYVDTQHAFTEKLNALGPSDVCVDLGAHLGYYTKLFSEAAGRVIAFEPDPWTYRELTARVGELSNVELRNAAVGSVDGTATLMRGKNFDKSPETAGQSNSIVAEKLNVDHENTVDVPVVDILTLLAELDCEIAILKVDIEGAEVEMLERLLDSDRCRQIRDVFVETHEDRVPALAQRTEALRRRVALLERPRVDLYWH